MATITGDVLEKAAKELREPRDPDEKLCAIKTLRERLTEWKPDENEQAFTLTNLDNDSFLLRFLRARKFDEEKALQLFINYHKFRNKYASVTANLDASSLDAVLRSGVVGVLDTRMYDGSKVVCIYPGRWDYEYVPFVDNFRAILFLLEELITDEANQVHGFTVLYNFDGVSIYTVLKLLQTEQIQKAMLIELLQDAFPARFKGIHLLNQPWYISMVLAIVRPFMKQKLRDRLHLHGASYESLHQLVDPTTLPSDFGGEQAPLSPNSVVNLLQGN